MVRCGLTGSRIGPTAATCTSAILHNLVRRCGPLTVDVRPHKLPMRYALLAVVLAALLVAGEWTYRSFLRPVDPPTPEMLALGARLKEAGLLDRFYSVRHGFRHSEVSAHGAYQLKNFPLPVSVSACPTEEAAEAHRQAIERSPNLVSPVRNGHLVIWFPMWADDTKEMMARVTSVVSAKVSK